jgi:Spy/CpxP family protein refolding chaperone
MKKWILSGMIITGLAVAAAVWAQPPPGQGPHGKRGCEFGAGRGIQALLTRNDLAEKAGITPEQLEKLRKIVYESQKEAIRFRADVELARLDLRHLLQEEDPSEKEVMSVLERVHEAELQAKKSALRTKLQVREIVGTDLLMKLHQRQCRGASSADRGRVREKHGRMPSERRQGDRPRRPPPADDPMPSPEE